MSDAKDMQSICKKCKEEKTKIFSHKGKRTKIYRDETGKMWMGLLCPVCYKSEQKMRMRDRRAKGLAI